MATFFKWLATEKNIQVEQGPPDQWSLYDYSDVCFFVGLYKWGSSWYWETYPPTSASNIQWLVDEPVYDDMACVIPVINVQ